jgi:acetylornithine deacetylase/succinyl-diaminopimelate desuccinylase-like protein
MRRHRAIDTARLDQQNGPKVSPLDHKARRCGPRSRNIHGTDEAVELASIVSGARTMARFIAGFFMSGGLR